MSVRRLPVYILADCSGSMAGSYIQSVEQGINSIHGELMTDPQAVETAFLSVITFNSTAQQIVPLTDLASFVPPALTAGGTTALGDALTTLLQCVESEVKKGSGEQKADWKPLVFLMTDGNPTDDWQTAAQNVKNRKLGNIVAVAIGADSMDTSILKQITSNVMVMSDTSPGAFAQFFAWVSASIKGTSAKCGAEPAAAAGGVALPAAPPTFVIVP